MQAYAELEQHIIDIFNRAKNIEIFWKGAIYNQFAAYKPTVAKGECKTDIYIQLSHTEYPRNEVIKISVKKEDAEFLVNKMKADHAEALLGANWRSILISSINEIQDLFMSKEICFVKEGVLNFTLGWKLEITNKQRTLSTPLLLTKMDIIDNVYRGLNQDISKRNALVGGTIVESSGIADYLLTGNIRDFDNIEDVLNRLVVLDLENFEPPALYLVFTANNYRFNENKTDGNRHLAVGINWEYNPNKDVFIANFIFNDPLNLSGNVPYKNQVDAAMDLYGVSMENLANTMYQIEVEIV